MDFSLNQAEKGWRIKMKEVKAYQCEYCGRLFKINSHVACKQSPSVKHCGDCKFHFERDANVHSNRTDIRIVDCDFELKGVL